MLMYFVTELLGRNLIQVLPQWRCDWCDKWPLSPVSPNTDHFMNRMLQSFLSSYYDSHFVNTNTEISEYSERITHQVHR